MSTLATNNITNEPGTGGPDFSHMPSVGGDPVVESGSNSDGEWTRWADGTQQFTRIMSDNNGYSDGQFSRTWLTPPMPVLNNREVVFTASAYASFSTNPSGTWRIEFERASGYDNFETRFYAIRGSGSSSSAVTEILAQAASRWK